MTAEHAEAGLKVLSANRFELVLTDYALPGNTGTWMVAEARRTGLLQGARTIVITAHPTIDNPEKLEVIRKPLDVDDFLARIHALLGPARSKVMDATRDWFSQYVGGTRGDRKLELVLYISANSPSSLRAVRNLQAVLERYDMKQIDFRICDLSREPGDAGAEDKIAFTPTIVKRWPEPRTWILGDLENITVLEDLLLVSGVEKRQ
jgi:hypothetical protein